MNEIDIFDGPERDCAKCKYHLTAADQCVTCGVCLVCVWGRDAYKAFCPACEMKKQPQENEPMELTRAMTLVLIILSNGPRHGYSIMTEIDRVTNGAYTVKAGTLYRSIYQMEKRGLLQEIHDHQLFDSEDDERRRYYKITDKGRQAVQTELFRMGQLVQIARNLIKEECSDTE